MRFIVIGTSEFTLNCTQALIDNCEDICALISMPKQDLPLNSANISEFAKSNNIAYHEIRDINSPDSIAILSKYKPDYILSSWPKILKKEVLKIPRVYCIGSHPTELPYNRGRHPLQWMIILRFSKSKLSFFIMDKGVDTGKILLQIPFTISSNDHIRDIISKMNKVAYEGIIILCNKLKSYTPKVTEQDNSKANYWRKRTPHDTILDLRMPSGLILRIVRSFSQPYPCAKLIFGKHAIDISNASIAQTNLSNLELKRIEPGKIITIKEKLIKVKVDDAIVNLESTTKIPSDLLKEVYISPPTKYITEWPKNFLRKLL